MKITAKRRTIFVPIVLEINIDSFEDLKELSDMICSSPEDRVKARTLINELYQKAACEQHHENS